ncbi:MAG: transferrin-binding protein-like solute binding protein [Moraxella sp.]|nr:transferrin-binding protein-like solute binding protein [Moraxella sp.]
MKITQTLSVILGVALLSACGSSDNGGSSLLSAVNKTTPASTPAPESGATTTTTTQNSTTNTTSGTSFIYTDLSSAASSTSGSTGSTSSSGASSGIRSTGILGYANSIDHTKTGLHPTFHSFGSTFTTDNIDQVIIDGATFDLSKQSYTTGAAMSELRYGRLLEQNEQSAFFVQGNASKSIPAQGRATYKGSAVHGMMVGTSTLVEVVPAQFQVDFDKKTVQGTISSSAPVELSATISGNSFSGTKSDVRTTGYFYGDDAAQIGGVYLNNDSSISGSFGAQK